MDYLMGFNNFFNMNNNFFMNSFALMRPLSFPDLSFFTLGANITPAPYSSLGNPGLFDYARYQITRFAPTLKNTFSDKVLYAQNSKSYRSSKISVKDPNFLAKVKDISSRLGCDYRDLLALMKSESGLNSRAVNKQSGATGLIQFMPKTARGLGTTVDSLRNMSAIQQLDYVEKYLQRCKQTYLPGKQTLSAGDLYALTYRPAMAKKNILSHSGELAYSQNKGLDKNRDGYITKDELGQRLSNFSISA